MTHGIIADEINLDSDYKSAYRDIVYTAEVMLRSKLIEHYNHVAQYLDKKHIHKANVLLVAIEVLDGKKTYDDLRDTIAKYPSYNQASFSSDTEKLVYKAIQLAPPNKSNNDEVYIPSKDQMKLIIELQTQLNAVIGKNDEKHIHKTQVLETAIAVLKGLKDKKEISSAIKQFPRYNEAFFTSKTEQLVNKVFELALRDPTANKKND